jgi:uncharacterized Zn finger protein
MEEKLICEKCGVPLETKKTVLKYMGLDFNADLPCCPVCGQVYIPEDLARGRLTEVEHLLEEK